MLIAIVAMTSDRLIGKNNTLPRHLPADLKRFKEITLWHTVIMGRKTYESLPETFRPLPGRHNIVLSSQPHYRLITEKPDTSIQVYNSIEEILNRHNEHKDEEVYLIGWSQIYKSFLPYCDQLYVTEIRWDYEWDTYFPEFKSEFQEVSRERHGTHDFVHYKRNSEPINSHL
jgi:dihydrofolate reductase